MKTLGVVAAHALHAFALFGFGRLVLRCTGHGKLGAAMSATVGLAAIVILGGVLNLARAAAAPSPFIVLAVGTALGLAAIPWRTLAQERVALGSDTFVCGLMCVLTLVLCAAILPTPTFNHYDDLQKYFAHPVRMLQTGTVFGSSLSAIGFETLGGQAYLHSFVLSLGQLDMLHAADSVLAFVLMLTLLGTTPTQHATPRWIAMAAAALINPQIVNVSATYTAAALGTALVLLQRDANASSRGGAVLAGLFLAALVALKSSLGLYVLTLGLALSAARLTSASWVACGRFIGICGGTAVACVAPWLLVHLSHARLVSEQRSPPTSPSLAPAYSVEPFSWTDWGYGTGFAPYSYAVLALLALALMLFIRARPRGYELHVTLWLAIGTALLYVSMLYVVGPVSQGELTMLRLFAPMLIGTLPALYVLAAGSLARSGRRAIVVAGLVAVAPLLSFVPFAQERVQRALVHGSVFVVARLDQSPSYRELNRYMLHGRMQQQVRAAQAAIPAGVQFVAWIGAPFWLDFQRNPVTDLDMAGLATPWSRIPDARFVLWEFAGATTGQIRGFEEVRRSSGQMAARIGDAGLRFTHMLLSLEPRPTVRWNDGQFLVFELQDPAQLRERYLTTRIETPLRAPRTR
jgi:hypothetical protein